MTVGPLAHALPEPLRATSEAQATELLEQRRLRGRRDTKRSDWRGVRADAISSVVQDSGISSGPASGLAGDRGDDLAGGTGPKRCGGSGPNASSSSGLFPAQREGNQTAIPGHGKGPLLPVLPVNTGHALPSPVSAHGALIKNKKLGPQAPGFRPFPIRPSNSRSRPPR